ncbi:MAG: DUF362 domain-containing protein [Candidatus Lokiarchaeota archaeon]
MNELNNSTQESPRVTIVKGLSPSKNFMEGIENLGGIEKFIKSEDKVFIKINLMSLGGYPTNIDFDLLKCVVKECNRVGCDVIVGAFPYFNISTRQISVMLGLQSFFENIGVKFILLDKSDLLYNRKLKEKELKNIKHEWFDIISIEDRKYLFPKSILKTNKLIIINQFNVDPVFGFNLSFLNLLHLVPYFSRKIESSPEKFKDFLNKSNKINVSDYYSQLIATKCVDIYKIKRPNLIINDLFCILEGAGPLIFTDSNLKKTNLTIIGNDIVSTDIITSRVLEQNIYENEIILEARERRIGPSELSDIEVVNSNIEENQIKIIKCPKKLENLDVINCDIKTGEICSGCFKQLYFLLNFLKTYAIKDLKYLQNFSLLSGLNPPDPRNNKDIIIFGDCAIKSTKDSQYRSKTIKTLIKKNEKEVKNKDILEIAGCPPTIELTFKAIYNYFGKAKMPSLNFFLKMGKLIEEKTYKTNLTKFEEAFLKNV